MKDAEFFDRLQPLLDHALAGSIAALNHLLELCSDFLNRRGRRLLGPALRGKVSPSDLAQETCWKASRRLHTFRGGTARKFLNWLRRIQDRQLVDWARKASFREAAPQEDSSRQNSPLIDPQETPKTAAINAEQRRLGQAALDRLDPECRALIVLRLEEKLGYQEIAERLALKSAEAAGRKYKEARERFLAILKGNHGS